MPDDKRRRRRRIDENPADDFDWDEFERSLNMSKPRRSRYNQEDEIEEEEVYYEEKPQPSRRRTQQNTNEKRRKRAKKADKRRSRKKKKTVWRKIRFGILITCLVALVIGTGVTIGMYAAVSREMEALNIDSLMLNQSSFIYYTDEDGDYHELKMLQADTNSIRVESSEISQYAKDAIVAIEDERFFQHNGVDLKRTAGATVKYLLAKLGVGEASYGGSTITQQVIKNITNEKDRTSGRKIKEIFRALALEKRMTKDEILTLYLNIVYFANNCNGIEAASNIYFNKHASELNLQEAASIAGITQFPSQYDPFANPENNVEKRNIVLGKMLELGMVDQDQYDKAVSSKLVTDKSYRRAQNEVTSYFEDQVVNDVIRDLMEKNNYPEEIATQMVYNGGLRIYSTIDMDIQEIMEDVFEDTSNFPSTGKNGQSAMVITDPYTGAVKGLVGGLGKKNDIRGWNRATQMKRQPGSSLKPLSVYAPAVDKNDITEATIIKDEPITIGSDEWQPKNSYNDFYGDMTIREAVARSSNIPAVKVLDELGLGTSYGYLKDKFHLSSLSDKDRNYSSLALGGLTEGVSPLEMAAAYGVFLNSGKYIAPYTYTHVMDSSGITILQNGPTSSQAISSDAAFITANLLSGVVNSSMGTGRSAKLNDMPAYGKTGTTDDDFDKWFVGFTPYYVGAVWYGFDKPMSISQAGVSGNPCISAWKQVMNKIHSSLVLPEKELEAPDSLVKESICMDTGKLARSGCDAVTAYFIEGTQPKNKCNSSVEKSSIDKNTPNPSTSPTPSADSTARPNSTNEPGSISDIIDGYYNGPGANSATTPGGTGSGTVSPGSAVNPGSATSSGNTNSGTTNSGGVVNPGTAGSGNTNSGSTNSGGAANSGTINRPNQNPSTGAATAPGGSATGTTSSDAGSAAAGGGAAAGNLDDM